MHTVDRSRTHTPGNDRPLLIVTLPGMRFREDWLNPVVTVPYVPTLGPVGPGALSAQLFNAVIDIAGTGRFLPYDKDQRWSNTKNERTLIEKIIHEPGRAVIPTLTTRGRSLMKIYSYGEDPPQSSRLTECAHAWVTTSGAAAGQVIWFTHSPEGARIRLMLKTFSDQDIRPPGPVLNLQECEVAHTFPTFAAQLTADGFAFLQQRLQAGLSDGPILVTVEDRRIVGALGPLTLLPDIAGTPTQPPQYFAVHPDYRHRGHGRALWQAAMNWGATNGAKYKVLQTATGSPAEQLYLSEGLSTLGFLLSADLPAC